MARTYDDGILPISFLADADLSAKQYYCVAAASTAGYVKTGTGASNPYPLGIQQDDDADAVSDAVSVKVFGFTKAVVAACAISGAASPVGVTDMLTCGSDGKLYVSGSDALACAKSYEALSTGSGILNVFFFGAAGGCPGAAS